MVHAFHTSIMVELPGPINILPFCNALEWLVDEKGN